MKPGLMVSKYLRKNKTHLPMMVRVAVTLIKRSKYKKFTQLFFLLLLIASSQNCTEQMLAQQR